MSIKIYNREYVLHSLAGPAVIHEDGSKEW